MHFISKYRKLILFSIPVISLLLHWHVFSLDLVGIHVWRQTETQTVINNFYRDDLNIFNARINNFIWHGDRSFRLEFPLMQWLYALVYKLFGPGIIVSRILSFLVGLCSVYGMYYLGLAVFKDRAIAVICAWCFNFSPVFYYYTLNPMPDIMALCFGIWCVAFFFTYINTTRKRYLLLSALSFAIAILIKLPFILYGAVFITFFLLQLRSRNKTLKEVLKTAFIYLLFALVALSWYMYVIPRYWKGMLVLKGVSGVHLQPAAVINILWGNLISVLPELLINYGSVLFFIAGFYFLYKNKAYSKKTFIILPVWGISVLSYFFFELNVICLVHDYYLLIFLPLIFLPVAYGAFSLLSADNKIARALAITCLAILPLTAYLRANSRWDTSDPGFNSTYFTYKKELRQLVPENAYVVSGNDVSEQITLYYIDRKGWTFDADKMDGILLSIYINKGASYLFTDSRIDQKPDIIPHLEQKIFDKGMLRVYKLK